MQKDELAALDGLLMRLKISQRERERGPSGTLGEKLHSLSQRMLHDFTTLKTESAKVVNDAHLSGEGKRARLAELATKHKWSYLEEVRTETKASRDRLATLLFSPPTSKEDPVLARLDAREIRDAVKGLPQPKIDLMFLNAVNAGRHETVRALTEGPLGSLVSDDLQQRAKTEHAQKTQPAIYENFQQVKLLEEHLDGLHNHATGALRDMGLGSVGSTKKEGSR